MNTKRKGWCSLYNCTWRERYLLSLSEEMNASQIMQLRNVNRKEALRIRQRAIEYCKSIGVKVIGQKVPTEAVLKATGKEIDYYYQKYILEKKAKED